jgi:hypothetical protein
MPAKRKRTKRFRPDPDYFRPQQEARVRARRAVCSLLSFWQACGHKECRRARACERATNDCFALFWPLVPEQMKISIRAGMDAKAAGLPQPEVAAAIARAQARWRHTQTPQNPGDAANAAPPVADAAAAPDRAAPPADASPRVRVL